MGRVPIPAVQILDRLALAAIRPDQFDDRTPNPLDSAPSAALVPLTI